MKTSEVISILATSVRPREAKDQKRYDEAIRMAIEALKAQSLVPAQMSGTSDAVSRQAAIDALMEQFKRNPTIAIRAKTDGGRLAIRTARTQHYSLR